jgi:hypothetical protein
MEETFTVAAAQKKVKICELKQRKLSGLYPLVKLAQRIFRIPTKESIPVFLIVISFMFSSISILR